MTVRAAALCLVLVASLGACSGEDVPGPRTRTHAVAAFEDPGPPEDASLLFEAYRRTDAERRQDVTLPPDTRNLMFFLDCVGEAGTLTVRDHAGEWAGLDCSTEEGSGYVVGAGDHEPLRRELELAVRAPQGSEWSVAVYAP